MTDFEVSGIHPFSVSSLYLLLEDQDANFQLCLQHHACLPVAMYPAISGHTRCESNKFLCGFKSMQSFLGVSL